MAKFFIFVATATCLVALANASANQDWGEDNENLYRSKRGGIPHQAYGASAGGSRIRGPAVLGGGAKLGGGSYGVSSGGAIGGYSGGYGRGGISSGSVSSGISGGSISSVSSALLAAGRQLYAGHGGLIPAAIQSSRQIQFYDVPSNREAAEPITVEVGASPASLLNIKFRSASSALNVDQDHEPSPGSVRETSSEDEPHRLIHTVHRPIYQEVHEVIKPYRKVTQEIQPVSEDIQTIVAKGDEIVGVGGGAGLVSGGGVISGGHISGGAIGLSGGHGGHSGYGATLGAGRAHHSGGLEQVQVPFARRAAGARRARA